VRRHFCDVRRLLHRAPGGGRFRTRPRRLLLRRLRGSQGGERRLPPLRRGLPPCRFPSPLPLPTTTDVARGERPCCSRSWNSSLLYSRRSRRRIPRSFLRVARSCSRRCVARVRSGLRRGRVGPRGVHGHPLLGSTKRQSRGGTWRKNKGKGEELTH
jgi:hypothetical protein